VESNTTPYQRADDHHDQGYPADQGYRVRKYASPVGYPAPQRGRMRAAPWAFGVAVVVFLALIAFAATNFVGGRGGNGAAPGTASGPSVGAVRARTAPATVRPTSDSAARPAPARTTAWGRPAEDADAQAGYPTTASDGTDVVYAVTASGAGNVGNVTYTDKNGEEVRLDGIKMPWRIEFTVAGQTKPLVLLTQREGGGDLGSVTCTVTVNGKVLSSTTATGQYAAAACSASG
jgi:hypothetical protein